jgi:hypothetical protein
MLIIEGLKDIKAVLRKMEDLRNKIQKYCADLDIQSLAYPDQKKQISEWLQAHHDLALKMTELKASIQATNLATQITIKVGENDVTRSIAEWVIRRREIIDLEVQAWSRLSERGLQDNQIRTQAGDTQVVKVRRYYDSAERDKQMEILTQEKTNIDKALEIANATTKLVA